jgi:hypothetical protein
VNSEREEPALSRGSVVASGTAARLDKPGREETYSMLLCDVARFREVNRVLRRGIRPFIGSIAVIPAVDEVCTRPFHPKKTLFQSRRFRHAVDRQR